MSDFSKIKGLYSFRNHFSTEKACVEYLEKLMWNGNVTCNHEDCGSSRVYKLTNNINYKCRDCNRKFNVKKNTIFESSKIPLVKWFEAIYLLISNKKGISSLQLARHLEITQKTAWFILHRARHILQSQVFHQLTGIIECDETFVGGKNKNRHHDKKVKNSQGRSFKDKTPVFGIVERGGKLIAKAIKDTKAESIQPLIFQYASQEATLMTDEWWAYRGLEKYYEHHIVDHGKGQYVSEDCYTNTLEGFWGIFKRGIIGIYHYVSRKHLQRYVDEFVFRYNYRGNSISETFSNIFQGKFGSLKYKSLIT